MNIKILSRHLLEILETDSKIAETEISSVSTDSRKCVTGSLFIAVRGEKFDGHEFVKDVLQQGAELAVVDHLVSDAPSDRQIVVSDTLDAYGRIGSYVRSLFKGKVIGLTGSAGKTTTKEEIKFLLEAFGKVYATHGNHNNFVGVPESLCEMDLTADYAVIEMGMSAKGEIERLSSYVKPDIAVVTNVYPMHIEFFENLAGIAEAKAEIFTGLKKGGIAVINADANYADILERKARAKTSNLFFFGKDNQPQVVFETQEEGEHHTYNAWCALKVVEALGLDVQKAAFKIKDFGALDGRGKKHRLKLSNGGFYTLIDDSYSGQPEAMKMALISMDKIKTQGRKIAVLGKMAELGALSKEKHIEIGKVLSSTSVDIVIGVCPEMKDMLKELKTGIKQYYFESKDGVADFLVGELLQNNDVVLIKGARYSSKLYQTAQNLIERGS